jgi:hypothetical protein
MTDEKLNELLELRAKASLAPNEHHLQRLIDLLSYTRYLGTYTQEEREHLVAQFKELSPEEQQEVLNRTYKLHPNFFNLSGEERGKLKAARKDLPLHERARISDVHIKTAGGIAWLDLMEVLDTRIQLDDRSSAARESRPYSHIYPDDFWQLNVETIDILESVKSDPLAIGHPAVVFAIYHWRRVIYTKRVIKREDVTFRDEIGQYFYDQWRGGRDIRSAENNLKAISKTLYDAAKRRMIPKESALALKMQWCGLLPEGNETVVFKAWEELKAEAIGAQADPDEIIKDLEPKLLERERVMLGKQPIYASRMMEFLRQGGKKGGRRFIGFDAEGNSLRTTWKDFRNAFAAWFFNLKQSAVQQYLEDAKKQNIVLDEIYEPSPTYPTTTIARIFTYLLTKPLIFARGPVLLRESVVGMGGIEEAIKKVSSNDDDIEREANGDRI